ATALLESARPDGFALPSYTTRGDTTGKDELRLLKFSVAATILVAWVCGPAAMAQDDRADNRGTPEQRAACTSDAFRYCSGEIPDAGRVEDCLRQRKAYLSDACRSAFEPRSAGSRAR
ncbi:cysteine rich repeat-containing protein, partial [Bradyrhizobium sp. SZCCHNS1054]|uniref:cysteine rich repeat-containing protein n=1 Tax=Bradyrhizobium sp. SZCCHNS1054 TaxID=3057301 RepID=UPI002916A97D